jgi:flagellar biosynthesis protein FlhG
MTVSTSAEPLRHSIVAITSGKGGVGKTSLTINLAVALARIGRRVGILDADLGLGNVDVMLGLAPAAHLGSVLSGELAVEDIGVEGPDGIRIVPAGSGIPALTALTSPQRRRFADAVDALCASLDFLLVDTAPGIADNVLDVLRLAHRVMVVTSNEPTAIVDAYAMVKVLLAGPAEREIGIVVNAARNGDEAQVVFRQLDAAVRRFLRRPVRYYGYVERDPALGDAVVSQSPLVTFQPDAPASRSFRRLALRVANWPSRGPAMVQPRPSIVGGLAAAAAEEEEAPRCA